MTVEQQPGEVNPSDLNEARKEFFHREGGVGKEAEWEEALEWVNSRLDAMDYLSEEERTGAKEKARWAMMSGDHLGNIRTEGWMSSGNFDTALSFAENWVSKEKERLEKGKQ